MPRFLPRLPRRQIAFVSVVALIAAVGVPAAAVDPSSWLTDDERRSSAERQGRQAEILGELDVLRATDVELSAEAARLDGRIAELEGRLAGIEDEMAAVEAQKAELEAELLEVRAEYETRQALAVERAVRVYMAPPADTFATLVGADDLVALQRQRILADQVVAEDRRVMADRAAAAAALSDVEDEVEALASELRDAAATQQADLAELRDSRRQAAALASALDERIGAFQREASSLAASEASLVNLISQRESAAAAAATTTTPVPPTSTTAPPNGGNGGGGGGSQPPGSQPPASQPPATQPPPSTGGGMLWPTNGVLTSPFGWRWGAMHAGIDIGAPSGTPIVAAAAGTVFFAGWNGGYGNLTLVDHGGGRITAYAHQSRFAVSGGAVSRGQVIGYVGSTGDSTGPHLHFEVRINGAAFDPMPFLR